MKKLLSLLGAIGLVATSSATVVSCGTDPAETDTAIAIGNVVVETTDMKATADAIKDAIKAASFADENVKSKMTSENVLDIEEPTISFDGSDATEAIAIDGITSAKLTFAKTDAVKNDTETVIGHAEVVIEVSFTLTTNEQPAPDTTIKAEDIQAQIGDNIKDLKDIDAVNTELAKYAKDGEKVIAGVETLVAALADGSKTDVVVTITPLTGYTIDGDATFTITGAIKSGETDKAIKAEDIQTTIGDHIKDLKDIDAVNTELAKYAKGGENAIDGVETLKAELADKSETDVVVTITPSTDYTIDGDATFTIAGAIQAPSL
jgi:hypothetical protein